MGWGRGQRSSREELLQGWTPCTLGNCPLGVCPLIDLHEDKNKCAVFGESQTAEAANEMYG
jgi:hypothetical protein